MLNFSDGENYLLEGSQFVLVLVLESKCLRIPLQASNRYVAECVSISIFLDADSFRIE